MERCLKTVVFVAAAVSAVMVAMTSAAAASPGPYVITSSNTVTATPPHPPSVGPVSVPSSHDRVVVPPVSSRAIPGKAGAVPDVTGCAVGKAAAAGRAHATGKVTSYTCARLSAAPAYSSLATTMGGSSVSTHRRPKVTPDGLIPNLAPGDWPDYCGSAIGLDYKVRSRYEECKVSNVTLTVYEVPSGKVLGTGAVQVLEWDTIAHSRQVWNHNVRLNLYRASGAVLTGEQIFSSLSCSTGCSISTSPPDQWTWLRLNQPLKGTYQLSAPTATVRTYGARLDLWFWNSAAPASQPHVGLAQVPTFRCDHATYLTGGGGCVFPEAGPVFSISESDPRVGASATFIYTAQVNLPDHWGASYSTFTGPPLHRLTDPAAITRNRNASCAGFVKKNPTDSCDEFPFASTHEGAAVVGKARTAVGHVPSAQNSYAGTLLAAEYQNDRIIENENFWVIITG